MARNAAERADRLRAALRAHLAAPHALAFVPATVLAAFWLGGEWLLVTLTLSWPLALAWARRAPRVAGPERPRAEPADPVLDIPRAEAMAAQALREARRACRGTACIAIELSGIVQHGDGPGERRMAEAAALCLARLRGRLRPGDRAARIGDRRFVVTLAPSPRLDVEALMETASRLQTALEEPARLAEVRLCPTAAIGICTEARIGPDADGEAFLDAALAALAEALRHGASAIRIWSEGLNADMRALSTVRAEVVPALEQGQIRPWFQPQICTSTGRVTGVEALARWVHPDRGVVSPVQFLDALDHGGHMVRLGQVIRAGAFEALRGWDAAGIGIPRVGVNLSEAELRDPSFVTMLKWELDRFGLGPERLVIEVLETVFAPEGDGAVAGTVAALKALGCGIDLDDFGTGNASILALHRMPVDRVKIDRSFVTRVDSDAGQRRMVCGILSLADQLGIATLAEGVESKGEHALLAQLGCDHVQGFGIARPMPAAQLAEWTRRHAAELAEAPRIVRRGG